MHCHGLCVFFTARGKAVETTLLECFLNLASHMLMHVPRKGCESIQSWLLEDIRWESLEVFGKFLSQVMEEEYSVSQPGSSLGVLMLGRRSNTKRNVLLREVVGEIGCRHAASLSVVLVRSSTPDVSDQIGQKQKKDQTIK
jgi:hypothetical protein